MAVALTAETPKPVDRTTSARDQRAYRLSSIDMVRGLVIVIMAIDHVRDFLMVAAEQDPMANPNVTVGLFVTRWITHFCAPVFVLLAGVSAGLVGARKGRAELTRFLVTRGLWLIFIEVAVISTEASFKPLGIPEAGGATVLILQVIWVIGASMILLAGFQWLGRPACFAIGAAILLSHNMVDTWWPPNNPFAEDRPLWVALHAQTAYRAGPFLVIVIYPLLAWLGVMLTGFGVAGMFELPTHRRNQWLFRVGVVLTLAFVVVRALDIYGDPNPWQLQPSGWIKTVIDFVNTTKYPPSLDFLMMTLGPAAILCAFADRFSGRLKDVLITFGRVPFAFYVAHFLLIHVIGVIIGVLEGFQARQLMTLFFYYPKGYGISLPAVYAIWVFVIAILYPWCRWMAALKARRRDWWLSYV
jgi:uncharacterized membrane protein